MSDISKGTNMEWDYNAINDVQWCHTLGKEYDLLGVCSDKGVVVIQLKFKWDANKQLVVNASLIHPLSIQPTYKLKWDVFETILKSCLLYTSPSPRDS